MDQEVAPAGDARASGWDRPRAGRGVRLGFLETPLPLPEIEPLYGSQHVQTVISHQRLDQEPVPPGMTPSGRAGEETGSIPRAGIQEAGHGGEADFVSPSLDISLIISYNLSA